MDRRRYVPTPEGLEDRALQSVFSSNGLNSLLTPTPNIPNTPAQKSVRIQHLPAFLEQIQPDRILPRATVKQLQADLSQAKGILHPPPSQALDNFNKMFRDILTHSSLREADAKALNQAFGVVLRAAGAPGPLADRLQDDMNELARADANGPNPVEVAANDYAIILQTTLGIGRPIRTPAAPVLAASDTVGPKGSHVTNVRLPHLVGSYDDTAATIQVLDESGRVVGSGPVQRGGRYSVAFRLPLSDGAHTVRVQATDSGETSDPSPPYTFKVVTHTPSVPHPQGPLGPSARS